MNNGGSDTDDNASSKNWNTNRFVSKTVQTAKDIVANLEYKKIVASSSLNEHTLPTEENIIVGSTTSGAVNSAAGAWVAATNTRDEYVMVILDDKKQITGVATQGRPNEEGNIVSYVTKYCVLVHNGIEWTTTFNGGATWVPYANSCQVFDGGLVASLKQNEFKRPVDAKIVKILIKEWQPSSQPPSMQLAVL